MTGTALSGRKYKAYPEYKESGVEWLDFLPFSWQIIKVKFLLKDGAEGIKIGPFGSALKLEDMVKKGIRVYGQENVIKKDFTLGKRFISHEKYSGMKVYTAEKGDILVTMMGTSGKCQVIPENADLGIIDSHLLKLRTNKKILPELFRLLVDEAQEVKNQISKQGKGSIMHGLNSTIVKELEFPLPSIEEQAHILNFLDHETAKIDTLIAKQEKLIELLKEKRQAVISHAVTKGLNPDAPMRDSGVEWLGEVPEHWGMKRLKYLGEAKNGLTYSPNDVVSEDEGVLVLRSSNIQDAKLSFTDNVYVDMDIPSRIRVKENDLLICSRNGSRKLIGKNALMTKEAVGMAFGAFMVIFRSEVNPYLYWVLNSPLFEYQSGSFLTSTINQLTIGNLEGMEVPLPPKNEQAEIKAYLINKTLNFDQLITKAIYKVKLLNERKTALISAAVTGKVDVRDWKPQGV
ncbi:restriction endonuclease subunit S [Pseudoalteromonas sp.]|uniref:restriction endonuclease subunit S n=1 Tax=unclassified Pseudoalteromonas TaxID=194690 RepID=UPI003F99A466